MIFYNAERFMDEAISSVMDQDMRDFELLLCDDGSSDGSTSIAKHWSAKHPATARYLQHEGHVNRGMSATRNLGLRSARGELIAFIDADDAWSSTKLTDQVALMDAMPEVGMVCGAVRYWRSWDGGEDIVVPTGHRQDSVIHPPETTLALYPLGAAAAPCPSDIIVRKSAVEEVGLFEEHFTGYRQAYEDQGFLAKLYLVRPVYFSSRVWLNYRQHAESIGATVGRQGAYDEVRRYFLTWFATYLSLRPTTPAAVDAAVSRALRPYRHPRLNAALSLLARVLHRSGALGAGLVARASQLRQPRPPG
jgi:glycosyltransferase involved in cell wall biosynthesis